MSSWTSCKLLFGAQEEPSVSAFFKAAKDFADSGRWLLQFRGFGEEPFG
jgi:hypothetical protein